MLMSKPASPPVYDLSNCASEPIHIPGSIQPHGILLGLEEPGLVIRVASRSAVPALSPSLDALLNVPVDRFLDESSLMTLRAALTLFDPFARGPFKVHTNEHAVFDATAHRS